MPYIWYFIFLLGYCMILNQIFYDKTFNENGGSCNYFLSLIFWKLFAIIIEERQKEFLRGVFACFEKEKKYKCSGFEISIL